MSNDLTPPWAGFEPASLHVPEVALDNMGYITGWSPAAETMFGYRADEAVAKLPKAYGGSEPRLSRALSDVMSGAEAIAAPMTPTVSTMPTTAPFTSAGSVFQTLLFVAWAKTSFVCCMTISSMPGVR